MTVVSVDRGIGPIILGQPHGGTHVPEAIRARLTRRGRQLADTDWHINRLYDGLLPDATVVQAHAHRYVIDVNRDPAGVSLYPGQNTTALVPLTDFDGHPLWQAGQAPSEDEIAARREAFHAPYHAALAAELARVKSRHGFAILYDCHSIRSDIPYLFEGRLPVFSIGTNDGTTCAPEIAAATHRVCQAAKGYDTVVNGRFKGGWTTRHYGRPDSGIHAIQMELAQRAYMQESAPWDWSEERASALRSHLKSILHGLSDVARSGALHGA
ncbi:N-formylglutamate deformylase [Shimia sp.]|uniref:N-formylglutamate deformylase n=1 Tax=Shimia sp. TaxID=1954381 RepID=UPI00356B4D04